MRIIRTRIRRSGNIAPDCPVLSPNCYRTRDRSTREVTRSVADRLAPARGRVSGLAGSLVRPHHGGVGISVERLGQAHLPAAGDRELRRLGNPVAALAGAILVGGGILRRIFPA